MRTLNGIKSIFEKKFFLYKIIIKMLIFIKCIYTIISYNICRHTIGIDFSINTPLGISCMQNGFTYTNELCIIEGIRRFLPQQLILITPETWHLYWLLYNHAVIIFVITFLLHNGFWSVVLVLNNMWTIQKPIENSRYQFNKEVLWVLLYSCETYEIHIVCSIYNIVIYVNANKCGV